MRSPGPELTDSRPPEQGISESTAYLLAEGANWLATGRTEHDLSKPMGRLLAQMDEVIAPEQQLEWLTSPHDGLDGHQPMEFVDADALEPLEQLLGDLAASGLTHRNGSGNGAG